MIEPVCVLHHIEINNYREIPTSTNIMSVPLLETLYGVSHIHIFLHTLKQPSNLATALTLSVGRTLAEAETERRMDNSC